MILPGIYENLDMQEYHADEALSRSDIVRLNLSPALYKTHKDIKKPCYRIGRAFHSHVLEGIPLVVNPNDLRSKVGKAFQAKNPTAIPEKEAVTIKAMTKSVKPFFGKGQPEVSFFWKEGDIMCKCRPDWLEGGVVLDLKTTRQALEDWHWDVRKYFYDMQHAWYLMGIERWIPISTFRFVVVEKNAPYRSRLFELEDLSRAWDMVDQGLTTYRQCKEKNNWFEPDVEIYKI